MYKILLPAILLLFQLNLLAQNIPVQLPNVPHPPSKPALRVAAGTTEISKPGKSLTYKWSKDHYIPTKDTAYYTYDSGGRLRSKRDSNSRQTNTYNNSGVPIFHSDSSRFDSGWGELITTYNDAGRPLEFLAIDSETGTWRVNSMFGYSYNSAGQDTLIYFAYYDKTSDTMKKLFSSSYQYDAEGNVILSVNHNYDYNTGVDNLQGEKYENIYDQQDRLIKQFLVAYVSKQYTDTSLESSFTYNNGVLATQILYSSNLPWIRFTDIIWRNYNNKSYPDQYDTTLISYTMQQYTGGMWKDSIKVQKTYPDQNGSFTYTEKTLMNGSYVLSKNDRTIYNDHHDLVVEYGFDRIIDGPTTIGGDSTFYHYSGIDKQFAVKYTYDSTGIHKIDSTAYFNFTDFSVTAVEEKTTSASAKLYPQPANNTMNVELPTAVNFSYEVKSTTGIQLTSGNIVSGASIDVSSLHAGIYFIEFENAGQKIIQKFIVE